MGKVSKNARVSGGKRVTQAKDMVKVIKAFMNARPRVRRLVLKPLYIPLLYHFGRQLGLAFQVVDDILDVKGNSETLGKTQGKDEQANKPTYVKLLGLEGAKDEAKRLLNEANSALEPFGESAEILRILNDDLRSIHGSDVNLYPPALKALMDKFNENTNEI